MHNLRKMETGQLQLGCLNGHGYIKEGDRPTIDITVDVQNAEVTTLIEQVREHALQEVITGPVIDLDEE